MPKPLTTAGYRKMAWDAKERKNWATAAQRKRLNATGRVTVKRNGKFITITKKV